MAQIESLCESESKSPSQIIQDHPRYSRYSLIRKLGEGGMAAAFLVRHPHIDEQRVLKVMLPHVALQEGAQKQFIQEAQYARGCNHPNIVQVLDVEVLGNGRAIIEMEFIDGVSLGHLLHEARAPLSMDLVVSLSRMIASGLESLHQQNLVHRDISPDNIMVSVDELGAPLVKIIDLGITEPAPRKREADSVFLGKPRYAAPECWQGLWDHRSDVYSFGLVLYQMVSGVYAYGADVNSVAEAAYHHLHSKPSPFSDSGRQQVPAVLQELILASLQKCPENRPQKLLHMLGVLDDLAEDYPLRQSAVNWLGMVVKKKGRGLFRGADEHSKMEQTSLAEIQFLIDEVFPITQKSAAISNDRDEVGSDHAKAEKKRQRLMGQELENQKLQDEKRLRQKVEHLRLTVANRRTWHFVERHLAELAASLVEQKTV